MKKIVLLMVVMAMAASPALAEIKGSKHDLSSRSGAVTNSQDNTASTEICVYCHTPHNANTQTGKYLPLWNRTISELTVTSVYNTSSSLSAEARQVTTTDVANADASLCLSCHDGLSLTDDLANPSNADGTPDTPNIAAGSNPIIDGNFSNDHPIAFEYKKAMLDDDELVAFATITSTTVIPFFGPSRDELWCSSCHDVHLGESPMFLVVSNSGSALCLTCHQK